jgi:hypothetical protein
MLEYTTLNFKNTIKSEYLQEEIYNLLDLTFLIPDYYSYNVFTVTKDYIARPDLISYDAYGDATFADIICKLNGVSNPFELNEGMKLIIPSPENILDFTRRVKKYPGEDIYQTDPKSTNSSAVGGSQGGSKTKQSKRQPNEAIIGDKRFKIDAAAGIIIY